MTTDEIRNALLATVGGLDAFASSFSWRTFRDLKQRAEAELHDGEYWIARGVELIREATKACATPATKEAELVAEFEARAIRSWGKYQAAGARTANWAVTGPARFPVERNNKRMEVERKRGDEFLTMCKGAGGWATKRERIATRRAFVEAVMACPPETSEKQIGSGRIIENPAIDRLQIVFEGKPDEELRKALKSRGFRWAPSVGVWQRQLTNNARWAAEAILKAAA